MTNNRLKGFTYGAVAAASYGMNPLFALPCTGGNECGLVLFGSLLFRRCDAGHPDESEETVLCAEEDGYTSAGGNGAAVLFSSFFLFESYNYMDAGIASTILFVYPVLVAIIMAVFFHEKVSFITMFSIALAFTGISLLYEGWGREDVEHAGRTVRYSLLADLRHIHRRREPLFTQKAALRRNSLSMLCSSASASMWCVWTLHGFAARPFAGAVGKCPFAGFVSHYHFVGADDALHPPHRLHAAAILGRWNR